jgi:hypothetical protein
MSKPVFLPPVNPNFEKGQLAIVLMANFTFKKACFNFDWMTISHDFPVN